MGKSTSFEAPRESQCDGKEAYASRLLAEKVAKRRRGGGQTVQVYRCPHCGAHHIGGAHAHQNRRGVH